MTGEVTAIRENGATSGVGVLGSYGYDDLGRRTSVTRGNGAVTSFGYDAVSRLNLLSHDLASTGADVTNTFAHNPASQIASRTRSNDSYAFGGFANVNRSDTINGLNQATATGATSLSHDARGNVTYDGVHPYGYTAENRLAASNMGIYIADAVGRMFLNTAQSHLLRYDGVERIAEYDNSSGTLLRRYVHGPGMDEPLVWYEGSGTSDRRWLHADERGSIVAVSDGSGTSIATNSYDDYGVPASGNSGRFQYTGQTWLPEIGMYYYKARVYHPVLGRFMQTDPIGYGDGMNLYGYVGSDPVNLVDPLGLQSGITIDIPCPPEPDPKAIKGSPITCKKITTVVVTGVRSWETYVSRAGPGTQGAIMPGGSLGGGGSGTLQNNKICDRPLPRGGTIRQNVKEIDDLLGSLLQSPDPSGASFGAFGYWLGKVSPGGDWADRLGEPGGNWNYGATGRAAGIPLGVLLRGAGAAEKLEALTGRTGSGSTGRGNPFGGAPYGDNPEGQKQIKEGYNASCN